MKAVKEAKQYLKNLETNKEIKEIPLIIDCDPGIDDALALVILAEFKNLFDIKLLSSCAGNTPINTTTENLRFFAENFFPGVKVAKGSRLPLIRHDAINASDVHGKSGIGSFIIGEQDYPVCPETIIEMRNIIENMEEPITIMALGPLTNIAKLLIMHPQVKSNIKCIYTMIGSTDGSGNITDYAEFNSYFDPEAFDIVIKSKIPLIINPMQIGNETRIKKSFFEKMPTTSLKTNLVKQLVESINETIDNTSICLFDPNTAMALIQPELYEFVPCNVEVFTTKTEGGKTYITEDEQGIHRLQKVKDKDNLNKQIIKILFEDN